MKTNVNPCKPQFYYIKVGFKGGQNYIGVFRDDMLSTNQIALNLRAPIGLELY